MIIVFQKDGCAILNESKYRKVAFENTPKRVIAVTENGTLEQYNQVQSMTLYNEKDNTRLDFKADEKEPKK